MIPKLNQIILADCMDIMKYIPDKFFELAIVDPPYGHKRFNKPDSIRNNIGSSRLRKYGHTEYNLFPPEEKYFKELFRISQNQVIWGANYYNQFLPNSQGWIFWYKHQPVHNFADGEFAFCSIDKPARCFDYPFWGSHGADIIRIHPNQKPVALYRWLLQNYAKPGDKIIDTHSGSGSLACACHLEKFEFLAIEKDPDYHAASDKRLEELRSQGVLF